MVDPEEMLTTAEASIELEVSDRRVRALITAGKLPAQKIGRDLLIRRQDLDAVRERRPGRPRREEPRG